MRVHYLIKEDRKIEGKAKPDLVSRWELTGGDNHGVLQQMFVISTEREPFPKDSLEPM
jgi:hypothetical protein